MMKNDETLSPDDPRLTAYALGELDGAERAEVEALLRDNPGMQATVESVRAMAAHMTAVLAEEPALTTPEAHQHGPESQRRAAMVDPSYHRLKKISDELNGSKYIKFPQFYYVASGLAAACFIMFVATRAPEPTKSPQKYYTEVVMTPVALPPSSATEAEQAVTEPSAQAGVSDAVKAKGISPVVVSVAEGKSSLLNQVMEERLKFTAPLPRESMTQFGYGGKVPRVASSPNAQNGEELGKVAVQPVALKTNYTYPQDDKFVVAAQSSGSSSSIVLAEPKPATPMSGSGLNTVLNFEFAVGRAQRGLTVGGGRMGRIPVGEVRQTRALAELGALTTSPRFTPNTEAYSYVHDNDFLGTAENPLSTFSIDVDTASYANVRRFLQGGVRPPVDAVRIEELVNYFPYRYAGPVTEKRGGGALPPIAAALEVATAPWAPEHRLVRIGLKGREVGTAARPAANLVFLLDVSGSMNESNKLPLVKESMRLLVGKLRPDDRVAIVTYAGNSGLALPSTPVSQAREIIEALEALSPGGSTNGAMGIELAYDIAKANFVKGGVNRVILCTDGDFNVGATSESALTRLIEQKAKSGVFLTALGFGMGNYKDATLEKLADRGNGTYGYIDSRREAEKLLVQQVNGTLLTIAKDVKIQVEFNPARVASYRLIGYENRLLKKEDFNNDQVDAGEIGAGHTVTALYEIVPVSAGAASASVAANNVDPLKYAEKEKSKSRFDPSRSSDELLTVKVRYKDPAGDVSEKLEFPLKDTGEQFADASTDFKFAAAAASFGMILRDSPHKGTATLAQVADWAQSGMDDDVGGWRGEFVELARTAEKLVQ